jgi:hypothetical protein
MPNIKTDKPIFISYSRVNRDFAADLRTRLEAEGYKVWRDIDDIENGEKFWQSIQEAIRGSDTVIMCLSQEALGSEFVNKERQLARENGIRVMLVVADDINFATAPRWVRERDCADFRPTAPEADRVWARVLKQLAEPYVPRQVCQIADVMQPVDRGQTQPASCG